MFSVCDKACLFGTYIRHFLIFNTSKYMSHTDKMAKNQTVWMVFQKSFSFMTEILFSFASKMMYPKLKQLKFIITVIY